MDKKSIKFGLLGGVLEVFYIVMVSLFFWGAGKWFDNDNNLLISIIMLILLVVSAAISGLLVFGYPIYLFVNKKDFKESLKTSALSIGVIFICLIISFLIYLIINH